MFPNIADHLHLWYFMVFGANLKMPAIKRCFVLEVYLVINLCGSSTATCVLGIDYKPSECSLICFCFLRSQTELAPNLLPAVNRCVSILLAEFVRQSYIWTSAVNNSRENFSSAILSTLVSRIVTFTTRMRDIRIPPSVPSVIVSIENALIAPIAQIV